MDAYDAYRVRGRYDRPGGPLAANYGTNQYMRWFRILENALPHARRYINYAKRVAQGTVAAGAAAGAYYGRKRFKNRGGITGYNDGNIRRKKFKPLLALPAPPPPKDLPDHMLSELGRKIKYQSGNKKSHSKMPYRNKKRVLRKKRRKRKRKFRSKNPHPLNVYRNMAGSNIDGASNQAYYKFFEVGQTSFLDALCNDVKILRVTDAGVSQIATVNLNNTALEGVNGVAFLKHKKTITIRNNSNFDCHIQAMWVRVKKPNADDTICDAIMTGLNDKFGTSYTLSGDDLVTNVNHYAEDSADFKRSYKIVKKKYMHFPADSETTFKVSCKPGYYNARDLDQSRIQQLNKKCAFLLLRIVGGISHASATLTSVGRGPFLLDYICQEECKYKMARATSHRFFYDFGGTLGSLTAPVQATEATVEQEDVTG